MADCFVQLFGEQLQSSNGLVSTRDALSDKVVGIYFSAHWCPPCRGFTPELATAYKANLASKGLEVVFVSSDNDQEQFDEYFAEMPWKALPYAAREQKAALSKQFKVKGIPTLVILDKDGSVITSDARSSVGQDPEGSDFPWRPKSFCEVIGTSFIGAGGVALDESAIAGKVLGLYFSAHWCPPCRAFTPQLAKWFTTVSPTLSEFQMIFVSSDRSQEAFDEYFAGMPWIALPYSERKRKEELSNMFDVNGIPSLIIVDKDGSVITTSGRGIPELDPTGEQFPWYPKPVADLAGGADGINDTPSLVVMLDGVDEATKAPICSALETVAKENKDKVKQSQDDPILFFTGDLKSVNLLNRIRSLTKQPPVLVKHEHPLSEVPDRENWECDGCGSSDKTVAYSCSGCNFDFCADCNQKATEKPEHPVFGVLLDLDDDGAYYLCDGVDFANPSSIRDHLSKYRSKSLERQQA